MPQTRQITAEQSPQTRGSSVERAHTGHHSFTGCGAGGVCGGFDEGEDILI
ncbi:MAG: hypothetical protein ACLGXA_05375 [Acidobacteriota bacterium]